MALWKSASRRREERLQAERLYRQKLDQLKLASEQATKNPTGISWIMGFSMAALFISLLFFAIAAPPIGSGSHLFISILAALGLFSAGVSWVIWIMKYPEWKMDQYRYAMEIQLQRKQALFDCC